MSNLKCLLRRQPKTDTVSRKSRNGIPSEIMIT